jgi:hypothetical protein
VGKLKEVGLDECKIHFFLNPSYFLELWICSQKAEEKESISSCCKKTCWKVTTWRTKLFEKYSLRNELLFF